MAFDLLAHRVVKVNGMYAVNGDFFRSAYRGNGIVLSETCEFYGKNGHVDTSMADGLLAGGAKAVMGYVNNVVLGVFPQYAVGRCEPDDRGRNAGTGRGLCQEHLRHR